MVMCKRHNKCSLPTNKPVFYCKWHLEFIRFCDLLRLLKSTTVCWSMVKMSLVLLQEYQSGKSSKSFLSMISISSWWIKRGKNSNFESYINWPNRNRSSLMHKITCTVARIVYFLMEVFLHNEQLLIRE